jgi:phosphatidylserine/phosphatidylglycerophosphate/cardiolipin synthase-like enzyme
VDGNAVLVSSQNWSTDGTLYNRDAGVIIHSDVAAQYFQQIFLHDWQHLAKQKAPAD